MHDKLAAILNDLAASFAGRNEYISRLCSFPLLIIDDLEWSVAQNTVWNRSTM